MQILEIHPEDRPYALSNTAVVKAMTTPRGDVEICRTDGEVHNVITVIPKHKRAELAQFLTTAE